MADAPPIRVLVADDEPLARQRLEDLLGVEAGVHVVGTAATGPAAVEAIRRLRPDVVFLDVQMPGATGLDVVRQVGADVMPPTIFVTAHATHAIDAFALAAVDYLMKPFDDERFEQAFARARRLLALEEAERQRARLVAALEAERAERGPPSEGWQDRFVVETAGRVRVIPALEVDYIVSDGPYAELWVAGRRHVIREAMHVLEERLDPAQFVRIHRSTIVRLDRVDGLVRLPNGDVEVALKGGTRLRVSRSRREGLERRLGL